MVRERVRARDGEAVPSPVPIGGDVRLDREFRTDLSSIPIKKLKDVTGNIQPSLCFLMAYDSKTDKWYPLQTDPGQLFTLPYGEVLYKTGTFTRLLVRDSSRQLVTSPYPSHNTNSVWLDVIGGIMILLPAQVNRISAVVSNHGPAVLYVGCDQFDFQKYIRLNVGEYYEFKNYVLTIYVYSESDTRAVGIEFMP